MLKKRETAVTAVIKKVSLEDILCFIPKKKINTHKINTNQFTTTTKKKQIKMATTTTWSREEHLALRFAVSAIAHRLEERSAENIHAFLLTLDHNSLSYIWNRSVEEIAAVLADAKVTEEDDAQIANCKLAERALQKSTALLVDIHMKLLYLQLQDQYLTAVLDGNNEN